MLEKSNLIKELSDLCLGPTSQQGFALRPDITLHNCDLLITNQCVAVFFAIADAGDDLGVLWRSAQSEIVRLKDTSTQSNFPRDLILTLISAMEKDRALTTEIVSDPYVCRKFVLYLDGRSVADSLELLPFGPSAEFQEGGSIRSQNVQETLTISGFDHDFVADLSRPLGVDKIIAKIEKAKYSFRGTTNPDRSLQEVTDNARALKDVFLKQTGSASARLRSMDLLDFRGMRKIEGGIDLSADVVFIYGANGTGKTSLFDALEWAVTGSVERLSWDPDEADGGQDSLVNLFSVSKNAQVSVELSTGEKVVRHLTIHGDLTNSLNGKSAKEDQIMKAFVRNAAPPSVDKGLLRRLVRHSHFLGQHSIREFISGGSESIDPAVYRFRVLSQLFGRQDFVRANDKLNRLIKKLDVIVSDLEEQLKIGAEQLQIRRRSIGEHRTALAERQASAQIGPLSSELGSFNKRLLEVEIYQAGSLDADVEAPGTLGGYLVEIETALGARSENLQKELSRIQRLLRELGARSIRSNRLKDLVERLKDLDKQIDTQEKDRSRLDEMVKESERQALAASVAEKRLNDELKKVDWAINNGPRVLDLRNRLSDHRKTLQHLEVNAIENERQRSALIERTDALKKEVSIKNSELESLKEKREHSRKLENALPSLREALVKLTNYLSQENALSVRLVSEEATSARLIEQVETTETEMARAEEELAIASQSKQRKDSLAAELAQYLDTEFCPLCGHDHESKELLLRRIEDQLMSAPPALVQIATKKEQIQKQLNDLQEQANTAQQLVASVSNQRNEFRHLADETRAFLNSWRLEAIQIGALSTDDNFEEFTKKENLNLSDEDYLALNKAISDLNRTIEAADRGIKELTEKGEQGHSEVSRNRELVSRALSELERLDQEAQERGVQLDGYAGNTAQKDRDSTVAALEIAKGKGKGIIDMGTYQKETLSKTVESLMWLRASYENLKKEQNLLLEEEDALNGLLSAEQLPIEVTEQAVNLRQVQIKRDLDTCAELQRQRARLYELVSIEALRDDISNENDRLKEETKKLAPTEAKIALYNSWATELKECKQSLGTEQKKTVEQQIEELEPTLNKIWKRLSPHPVFDDIKMEIVKSKGKEDNALRIKASVDGSTIEIGGKTLLDVPPSSYFSEAQMNVMAVSIFLAIALRQSWSGLRLIAIDDPVQQMDDLNANAFFDLIRGLVPSGHQFLIATCDQQLYRMALEKFACLNLNGKHRFIGYRLKGVSRQGPQIIRDTPSRN